MTQRLRTIIEIGGGVTNGLLNTFNPLRKKLQETEKGVNRLTRASSSLERAMKRTTDPVRYSRLLRRHTDILEKIKEQRRETARLTRASRQYTESLGQAGKAFAVLTAGAVGVRQVFGGIFQDFAEFKEVQAETGIEAARLAQISFGARPLVPGFSPERVADAVAQSARELQLRLQEAAAGRVGLKGYLVLPDLLDATRKGTQEPIEQLVTALRFVQRMPEHRRASALEEVVGGTEGEILTGLFRRGKVDDFILALENSTGTIYRAGQAMNQFWAVLIQVQQTLLAFGYTLFNAVAPALEPFAAIALKVATTLQKVFFGSEEVAKTLGATLVGATLLAAGALIFLAIKAVLPLIGGFITLFLPVLGAALGFLGLNVAMAPLIIGFLVLATAIGGLLLLLGQIPGLSLGGGGATTVNQANTFNIQGTDARGIGDEVMGRMTAASTAGRF